MECKWVFTFIIYFTPSVFSLFIDDTKTDFDSAWRNCFLATPTIDYSHKGNTMEIDLEDDLGEDESAWVGYVQDYEVFQYMGCTNLNSLTDSIQVSKITIEPDMGQCHSVCRTSQYFGLQTNGRTACRCVNVTNANEVFESLSSCSNAYNFNDPSVGEPPYDTIYKIVATGVGNILRESVNWDTAGYNCLKLQEPNVKPYQWGNCSDHIEPICVNKNDPSSVFFPEMYGSWKMATNICLDEDKFLMSYQSNQLTNRTSPFWTSNVRLFVIMEVTDGWVDILMFCEYVLSVLYEKISNEVGGIEHCRSSAETIINSYNRVKYFSYKTVNGIHSTLRRYGYIQRKSGNTYYLYFGQRDQSRKSLCNKKKEPDFHTSNSPITSSSAIATASTTVEKDVSTSTSFTTLASSSESFTDAFVGITEAGNDSNVAVFVSIPLVVILLICGVIAGVFFWRKRRLKKSSSDDLSKQNLTYSKHNINSIPNAELNSAEYYNEIDDIDESNREDYDTIKGDWESEPTRNSVDNHSYFVLEKTFRAAKSDDYDYAKEAERNDTLPQNHTYHVLEKTHKTNSSTPFTNNSTGYDYAKVSPKGSDEAANKGPKVEQMSRIASTYTDYDHLDDRRKETNVSHQVKTNDGDHVYDTSGKNTTTDTYDHINKDVRDVKGSPVKHAHRNNVQKNTYNDLKDISNNNNERYNRVKQEQSSVDDDELYNVINPPRVRPTNTDNPYDHTC